MFKITHYFYRPSQKVILVPLAFISQLRNESFFRLGTSGSTTFSKKIIDQNVKLGILIPINKEIYYHEDKFLLMDPDSNIWYADKKDPFNDDNRIFVQGTDDYYLNDPKKRLEKLKEQGYA